MKGTTCGSTSSTCCTRQIGPSYCSERAVRRCLRRLQVAGENVLGGCHVVWIGLNMGGHDLKLGLPFPQLSET